MIEQAALTDDSGTDVQRWFDEVTARADSAGVPVVFRLPTGGVLPGVVLEGPADDDQFMSLMRIFQPKVIYGEVHEWETSDVNAISDLLSAGDGTVEDYLDESPAAMAKRDRMLDRARTYLGQPASAELVLIGDGVRHGLRNLAGWRMLLNVDAYGVADHLSRNASAFWDRRGAREQAEAELLEAAVGLLEDQLRRDPAFHQITSSDRARRYARDLLRTQTGWLGDLPPRISGAASWAAANAWKWWRTDGITARRTALEAELPDLALHPSLVGTLAQRKSAARALLQERDPIAATPDLADKLARLSVAG